MNTNITCKKIANLLYLTDDEINSQEALLLAKHLESCSSCKNTREDFLVTRQTAIELDKGIPTYADFIKSTEILIKSGSTSNLAQPANPFKPFWHKTVSIVRYASTIAAVFLLFLFVWEQSISLRKITMLENRIQSIINPSEPGLIDRLTIARSVLTVKEWNDLAISSQVYKTPSSAQDLQHIKILLESRFRLEKPNDLALIHLFHSSIILKLNALTIKNLIR